MAINTGRLHILCSNWRFTLHCGSDGKESACNVGELGSIPGLGSSPGEGMATLPVFLPGESQGQRRLVGCSLWGCKESDTTEQLKHI